MILFDATDLINTFLRGLKQWTENMKKSLFFPLFFTTIQTKICKMRLLGILKIYTHSRIKPRFSFFFFFKLTYWNKWSIVDYNAKGGTISDLENSQGQSAESWNISVYIFISFFCFLYFPPAPAASHFHRQESRLGDFQFKPIWPFGFLHMWKF